MSHTWECVLNQHPSGQGSNSLEYIDPVNVILKLKAFYFQREEKYSTKLIYLGSLTVALWRNGSQRQDAVTSTRPPPLPAIEGQ